MVISGSTVMSDWTTNPTHKLTVERSTTDKFTMEEGFRHTMNRGTYYKFNKSR